MNKTVSIICAMLITSFSINSFGEKLNLTASTPTHYFYTPTTYVNKPYDLVVSLHEISYSFPSRLQVQASILDNIGRVNLGGKYGISDNFSVGAGLAYNFAHIGVGKHGIMASDRAYPRFGAYCAIGLSRTDKFECAITPHFQAGDRFSTGVDFGCMGTISDWISLIGENGTSFDFKSRYFWLNFDGGVRIHPPRIPFMQFDAGIDIEEFPVGHDHPTVAPYIDAIFSIQTKR